MRQASGYSEVEIDPATTEDQPAMYDNNESSPQKAESADDWQLVSLYDIVLLIVKCQGYTRRHFKTLYTTLVNQTRQTNGISAYCKLYL